MSGNNSFYKSITDSLEFYNFLKEQGVKQNELPLVFYSMDKLCQELKSREYYDSKVNELIKHSTLNN